MKAGLAPGEARWPEDWQVARFADVASYELGRTPPRKSAGYWAESGGIPWATISDMVPFSTIRATSEAVSELARADIFQSPPVPKGTLLMSFKLTIGRTAVLGVDAYHNEAIISIRPKDGIERDFLRFYLPTIEFTQHQDRAIKGQTLNKGKIGSLPVPVPPVAEQRAIAAVLAMIRAAVETQDRIVATLKELKAVTMAKLFREGLRGEPLKQTEIGEIPESWEVVRLGDYCSISSGGTPSRDRAEYWNGNIPWVKTGEINYRAITRTEEYITEAGLRDSSARLFRKGTLLMAMYGQGVTRGKVAHLAIDAATNQACAALLPKEELDSGYLYSYCAFAYERIRELGHGANQKNLSADLIREIRIPLPPSVDDQKRMCSKIQAIELRLHATEERLDGLRSLFFSMLHLLMTGKVRLPGFGRKPNLDSPWFTPEEVWGFVGRLVRKFDPERVILFGSRAWGTPTPDSDVDLLVVMEFEGRPADMAVRIGAECDDRFPMDLLVRRPAEVERRVVMGDPFFRQVLRDGLVLHERAA